MTRKGSDGDYPHNSTRYNPIWEHTYSFEFKRKTDKKLSNKQRNKAGLPYVSPTLFNTYRITYQGMKVNAQQKNTHT